MNIKEMVALYATYKNIWDIHSSRRIAAEYFMTKKLESKTTFNKGVVNKKRPYTLFRSLERFCVPIWQKTNWLFVTDSVQQNFFHA